MNQRFYTLDVFRGATVALMILVNNSGGTAYEPLRHAAWHGCTPTDLVFPFFLFAVGNAMAFSLPKLEAAGERAFWMKVIKRTLLIFGIGMLLSWFPFIKYDETGMLVGKPLSKLRIFGVLQRIALCYFFASVIIHYGKIKGSAIVSLLLLAGYWALCILANPADPYSIEGWFGTAFDKQFIGEDHMYHGEGFAFDPEGPMSTFAAIVQVILGYYVGYYIQLKGKSIALLQNLLLAGAALVLAGYCWGWFFPINKKIWTSSYVLYTSGLATLILSAMFYAIEFQGWKGLWSRFFDVFGKNPLFIYVMSGLIPRLLNLFRWPNGVNETGATKYATPFTWFYDHACTPLFSDPRNSSLMYALCFVALMWLIGWLMDRKGIYVKV